MTTTFATYTTRTTGYYISLMVLIIVPVTVFLIVNISGLQLSVQGSRYPGALCIFGVATYLLLRNSFVKMYTEDGQISFLDDGIKTSPKLFQLRDIKKIFIRANDYKGNQRGTSDGSGNRIEIHDQADKVHIYRFVIKSEDELKSLKKTMAEYSAKGITFMTTPF